MIIFSKIRNLITEILNPIISLVLWIILKPILILLKALFPNKIYKIINFKLIEITNIIFYYNQLRINKLVREQYNLREFRDSYDREGLNVYFKILRPEVLFKNKYVLDVGCGVGGKDFEILKYNPKKIFGIDLSSRNIKYAQELINKNNKDKLVFLKKDIFKFRDQGMFDTIISYTTFEHIDKQFLLPILNKMYKIIKNDGNILIVFNHYNDQFGTHLKEYIYHPWPQTIFKEEILFEYWNKKLKSDPKLTTDSYFPESYKHGAEEHNSDCFMNLNKLSIKEFQALIKMSNLKLIRRYDYSKSFILKLFPFFPKRYLEGSSLYYLKKDESPRKA